MLTRPSVCYAKPPADLPPYEQIAPFFYHVTTLPDGVVTPGIWDLRWHVDRYFASFDFYGKSVLEIGPASGFLTASMEQRGARVTAVDIPETPGWDLVPYATEQEPIAGQRRQAREHMPSMQATFWYTHRALGMRAKMIYTSASEIPADAGPFDVAVLAAVLLHMRHPHDAIERCAALADTLIIVDLFSPDLEAFPGPVVKFAANMSDRMDAGTWWHFSTQFLREYLHVLGFTKIEVVEHWQRYVPTDSLAHMFTMIARR